MLCVLRGVPKDFEGFYKVKRLAIPWSNSNAYYDDADHRLYQGESLVSCQIEANVLAGVSEHH
jgi:hypothetical protein